MEHQKHLEVLKLITVSQIQAFGHISDLMYEHKNDESLHSEVGQRSMCDTLGLTYDHWRYYDELANYMKLGMVPYMPMLQIACTAFVGASLPETLTRFSYIDKRLAVSAYEVGNEWLLDNHRLICTCRAIDALVSLYSAGILDIDPQEEKRCIAYPNMPNLPHQFAEMYRLIEESRMFVGGKWRSPVQFFNSKKRDYIWNTPPNMSDMQNVIIQTDVGTIYLTGAPKRGDTNANHLRSV